MSYTTLITVPQLRQLLGNADVVVIDASTDLSDPALGAKMYGEAHIPGARYVSLDTDLSGPKTGRNGRHPLPSREAFAQLAGQLGITPETQVVVYDRQDAAFAPRVWWMLRWIGHANVAVLDGNFAAWVAAGAPLERSVVARLDSAAPYPAQASLAPTVDIAQVQQRPAERIVLDARASERYRGDVEPLDPRAGHIPGALNRFFKDNLLPDGRFKPAAQLREEFTQRLQGAASDHVIHQCGSGVTACNNVLAMEIAGLSGSALFPGSWSEWSSDPQRAVQTGSDPG